MVGDIGHGGGGYLNTVLHAAQSKGFLGTGNEAIQAFRGIDGIFAKHSDGFTVFSHKLFRNQRPHTVMNSHQGSGRNPFESVPYRMKAGDTPLYKNLRAGEVLLVAVVFPISYERFR